MHLSTRGRYAIMALLDLVSLQDGVERKPVTLADIAERQELSLSYLEQLFAKLRRNGIVKSVRGPGGGYVLAKKPDETWLIEVINAVEEETDFTRCNGLKTKDHKPDAKKGGCVQGKQCNAHDLWVALGVHLEMFLQQVNLGMVLSGKVGADFSTSALACRPQKVSIQSS